VNDTSAYLGPVSGEAASSTAAKAEHFTLPAGALLPASAPAPSAHLLPVVRAGTAARAPSPGAAKKRAEAPGPARQPHRERHAMAAAGAPTSLIGFPAPAPRQVAPGSARSGVPPNAQQPRQVALGPARGGVPPAAQPPRGGAASGAPRTSIGAPAQAPAPSAALGRASSPYLVAWARQTDGPGPLVKAESVAPTPSSGAVVSAVGPARAAAALPPTPSPSLSARPAVPAAVTPSAAQAAPVSPVNKAAILFTGDGV